MRPLAQKQERRRLCALLQRGGEGEGLLLLVTLRLPPSVPRAQQRGCPGAAGLCGSPLSISSVREAEEHALRRVPPRVTRPLALPQEHRGLLLKMKEGEAELARLRSAEGDRLAEQDR